MLRIKNDKQSSAGGGTQSPGNRTETGRLSRFKWAIGAGIIATSVAVASILPEPLPPLRSAVSAAAHKAARVNVSPSDSSDPLRSPLMSLGSFFLPPAAAVDFAESSFESTGFAGIRRANTSVETAGQPIPGQHLTIRTDWGGELTGSFEEPLKTARLLFASTNPAHPASATGSFETRLVYRAGSIERSLFEDGRDAGLSDPLILKLAEIFGWDIDFALDLREGDRFVVIYEEKFWFGKKISDGAILAAEFWNRGRAYRAIGFRDAYGRVNYFTPAGKSLRRPFLRTPVQFGSVSSRFSTSRYHPILKTWRAHNGVDYSAPVGTAVHATANGRIMAVGPNGGYGNTIVIDHGNSFSTLYAHLSRYRPGLRVGQHVEQGEVIGYVGKTGLATGAHLHYEFQVHGKHQNPLAFEFPPGDAIAPVLRDEFSRSARAWVTRLDFLGGRQLAAR